MKVSANLGRYREMVVRTMNDLVRDRLMDRIWARDYTVWKPVPTEITNRLGWLDSPRVMAGHVEEILDFAAAVRKEGYTRVLLLGMGGSSLAPEVFRKTFGVATGYPDLSILDSTDPGAVSAHSRALDPRRTLFVVSTKSGGTVETFSFLKFFYNWVMNALGPEEAGRHFIAITDPGSGLAETAQNLRFRHVFYNDPDIGGRYSALSYFGLVPAALVGIDIGKLLGRAAAVADTQRTGGKAEDMNAAYLGVVMGELSKSGRDKLTFLFSDNIKSFGDWIEQLIAESTGKEGKGILPVVGELPGAPGVYGPDRLFVALGVAGHDVDSVALDRLEKAGHPVVRIEIPDIYDLGGQCFLWEMATAVAGARLGINPFDQPNVETAKVFARQIVAKILEEGGLHEDQPDFTEGDVALYGKFAGNGPREILANFLGAGAPGAYAAIQAYVQPTPDMDETLQHLRVTIRERYKLATTVGYGPRFLHSTGQLHKGDGGRGLFIQITTDDREDLPIPDEAGRKEANLTFGLLKAAQVLGDRRALLDAGRQVIRLHVKGDVAKHLMSLFS